VRLFDRWAQRRDERMVRELTSQFRQLRNAGWTDLNALNVVFDLAQKMEASPAARQAVCAYPPIRKTIQANPETLWIRSFLEDPELIFRFPG
jgi:hypothetical protein